MSTCCPEGDVSPQGGTAGKKGGIVVPLGINVEVVGLFAVRSGCSGAFTDGRAHLFSSPHGSHTSHAAAKRVSIFVFYHDLICVLKASLSFGSAEQAHFLSLSPSSFLDD